MKKKLYFIIITLFFVSFLNSCSQDDELTVDTEDTTILKSSLLDYTDSISEPIIPIEVDPIKYAEYLEFKKQNADLFDMTTLTPLTETENTASTRGILNSYNLESTTNDNLYAIRDMPISISIRQAVNGGYVNLVTSGKNKEIKFGIPERFSRPSRGSYYQFYFKAVPAVTGVSSLLYSYADKTPISVGYYRNNPDNYFLFTLPDEKASRMAYFNFSSSNTNKYFIWQSEALIASGNSGLWYDIYYKAAEARNDNKTGFSQYVKKATQEWQITPEPTFTVGDITFINSHNTKIISSREEKVKKGISNPYYNTTIPELRLDFDKNVTEESTFMTKEGVNFRLSNTQYYRLPSVFKNNIITLPDQNSPKDALYRENKQFLNRQLGSFVKLNDTQPRERCEAVFTYTRYEIEVDFTVDLSCVYNSTNRQTKLRGVWRGVLYVDERKPVYYEYYNIDTNQLLESGYLDISGTSSNRSASNVPTIKRKMK